MGGALNFNGTSEFLTVPVIPEYMVVVNSNTQSSFIYLEAWIRPTAGGGTYTIFDFYGNGNTFGGILLRVADSGVLDSVDSFISLTKGSANTSGVSRLAHHVPIATIRTPQLFDGNFHHLMIKIQGGGPGVHFVLDNSTVYSKSGVSDSSSSPNTFMSSWDLDTIYIGRRQNGTNYFKGDIANIAIYKGITTDSEISQRYNRGMGANPASLMGRALLNLKLDEVSGNLAADSSIYNNPATLNGFSVGRLLQNGGAWIKAA
jgi:hypothetical protein